MVPLVIHRPLLSTYYAPGRVLETEATAVHEIILCLHEAGILVGRVAINITTRDGRCEEGQLTRHTEHVLPNEGTITASFSMGRDARWADRRDLQVVR